MCKTSSKSHSTWHVTYHEKWTASANSTMICSCNMPVLALTRPQSLTAECNLSSFCVKLSKRIFSQWFSLFSIFQVINWSMMKTAESPKFSRKRQFCLSLTVGCVLHLAPAIHSSWHSACVSKISKSLCAFTHSAVVASLRGLYGEIVCNKAALMDESWAPSQLFYFKMRYKLTTRLIAPSDW